MFSRGKAPLALSFFSCLLTLVASGDDFCLPRLLFPVTLAPAEPLPLDDANTDFVTAADSSGARPSHVCPFRDGDLAGPWQGVRCSIPRGGTTPREAALPGARHFPDDELNSPLRC
jgi:hypothetical protein